MGVQGEEFDWSGDAGSEARFATSQVLTDQTLAWLQDTGWCVKAHTCHTYCVCVLQQHRNALLL